MDEYQIKLAASKSEVPVNFLVEMILGVPAETLERSRSYYDPNEPWRDCVSLLPGAGKAGFPVGGDETRPGYNEWLVMRAYKFLTQCMVLRFGLEESEFLVNKISTLEFSLWMKSDDIVKQLGDMDIKVSKKVRKFIGLVLKKDGVASKPQGKEANKGGNPGVDPDGVIAEKIKELRVAGVQDSDIPWDKRFTSCVQKVRKHKIDTAYHDHINKKIPPRVIKKEYTAQVGISLDTAKKLIQPTSK